MIERNRLSLILLHYTKLGYRLFRNEVKRGWTGKMERWPMPVSVRVNPQDVVIRNAHPVYAGLADGSSDLIGWREVVITPEMVGRKIAQFVGIEEKSTNDAVRPNQENWKNQINKAGGYAIVIREQEEYPHVVNI